MRSVALDVELVASRARPALLVRVRVRVRIRPALLVRVRVRR